jgi:hypothetical protein
MQLDENFTKLHQDNDDVVDVVDKINTTEIPPTVVSISFDVNQKLNELLDLIYPDFEEKAIHRQQSIEQIFLLGINTKLKSIQQHQQHQQCFFEINGNLPRLDVLDNYAKLAYVLEHGTNFPKFGEKFLRNVIQFTLKVSDDRTIKKYLSGIMSYSTKIPHASGYDVSCFCKSIPESLKIKTREILEENV